MKKLLIAMAVATAACSGRSITAPSSSTSATQAPSVQAASDAAGNPSGDAEETPAEATVGRAASPRWSIDGPQGCVDAGADPMQWAVNISDAGPLPLRFVALAHQSMEPGCAQTIENPRARVQIDGVRDYPDHTAGQTIFTFDPKHYSCGRSQIDVSIFDAQGKEWLIVGMIVNYGKACEVAPPTPNPPAPNPPTPEPPFVAELACTPGSQAALAEQPIALSASGGTGDYTWTGPGTPPAGQGSAFQTVFAEAGTHLVTVRSGEETVSCQVIVTAPPPPPVTSTLACSPLTQEVFANSSATFTATGGTGSYGWSGGGVPATGQGVSFQSSFAGLGVHTLTVTSGEQSAACEVNVKTPPPPPVVGGQGCTPGYWKQPHHYDSWTGYSPGTPFSAVFEDAFPGKVLGEVLALQGGDLEALGRQAVAALLNATSPGVAYDLDASTVIGEFNRVHPGGSYEPLKDRFTALNEQGCWLN